MDAKKECLSKRFFRENPLMDLSAAMIAYSTITIGQSEELNQMISDTVEKEIDEESISSGRTLSTLSSSISSVTAKKSFFISFIIV